MVADRFLDVRDFFHPRTCSAAQNHRQTVAHVLRCEAKEPLSALVGESEADAGLAVLIATGLRIAKIFSAHR